MANRARRNRNENDEERRSPFKDGRVVAVLLLASVVIVTLVVGFVILARRVSVIEEARQQPPLDFQPTSFTPNITETNVDVPNTGLSSMQQTSEPTSHPTSNPSSNPTPIPLKFTSFAEMTPAPTNRPGQILSLSLPPVVSRGDFNISTPITSNEDDFQFFDGCMFNIRVKSSSGSNCAKFRLTAMDTLLKDTNGEQIPIEIYTKTGGYRGFENARGEWTNVLRFNQVWIQGNGPNRFSHLKENFFSGFNVAPIWLWEGQTRAFYITVAEKGLSAMIAQNGVEEGQPYLENGDLEITDGTCFAYPFNLDSDVSSNITVPMRWLGSIMYVETAFSGIRCIPP